MEEYKKYKFKRAYIYKLINEIDNDNIDLDNIDLDNSTYTITELIEDKTKKISIEDEINKVLETEIQHVFQQQKTRIRKIKELSHKTMSEFRDKVKQLVKEPFTDKLLYTVRAKYSPENKNMLSFVCSKNLIKTDLVVSPAAGENMTITYSMEEYQKYKFKLDHIHRMISGLHYETINLKRLSYSITDFIEGKADKPSELEEVNKVLQLHIHHVFHNGKEIKELAYKKFDDMANAIKKYFKNITTEQYLYIVRVGYRIDDYECALSLSCSKFILGTKLNFYPDMGQYVSILYSKNEYKKHKFKLEHVENVINGIETGIMSLKHTSYSITQLLEGKTDRKNR